VNLAQAENLRDDKQRIVVKRHHIKVTVDLSSDFKEYMKSVRKKDESDRALLVRNRDDHYKAASSELSESEEYE
jgi:16S rRNA U1498 N3-methylase RsmE